MSRILFRWNLLPLDEAAGEILPCCGSHAWARKMASGRPFEDVAVLLETSDRIFRGLTDTDWSEAFQSHPRIGSTVSAGKSSVRSLEWSVQEQRFATEAVDSRRQALAEGNLEYELKFQRIFIICATGKSVDEILENLRRRLTNDEMTELHEAAEQQRQITQIRLRKWLIE